MPARTLRKRPLTSWLKTTPYAIDFEPDNADGKEWQASILDRAPADSP